MHYSFIVHLLNHIYSVSTIYLHYLQGEEECEEGHSVVEREAERDTGVLGQILDVFK